MRDENVEPRCVILIETPHGDRRAVYATCWRTRKEKRKNQHFQDKTTLLSLTVYEENRNVTLKPSVVRSWAEIQVKPRWD